MCLKDAKLELGSNAWAGVEDFNWLKKVDVVAVHVVPNVVAPMLTDTVCDSNSFARRGAQIGRFCPRRNGARLISRAEAQGGTQKQTPHARRARRQSNKSGSKVV